MATMTIGEGVTGGFSGAAAVLGFDAPGMVPTTVTDTVIRFTSATQTYVIRGVGLATTFESGFPVGTGGTVTSIRALSGEDTVLLINDVAWQWTDLSAAIVSEVTGTDRSAFDRILFGEDYLYLGNERADLLAVGVTNTGGFPISFAGDDSFLLREGNDNFALGDGNDTARGGEGRDTIFGEGGADNIYGADHADRLDGGAGNDSLYGGGARDQLFGGGDQDFLYGGGGGDSLDGGAQNDILYGGAAVDRLFGGDDNDDLYGGSHGDVLDGGSGDDQLVGGGGNDTLIGHDGNNLMTGGTGADTFDFTLLDLGFLAGGNNTILDFVVGRDALQLGSLAAWSIDPGSTHSLILLHSATSSTITLTGVAPGTLTIDDLI